MDKTYRKTQKHLMTHVYDRRTSYFWPAAHKALHLLSDENIERMEMRRYIAEPGASEWL